MRTRTGLAALSLFCAVFTAACSATTPGGASRPTDTVAWTHSTEPVPASRIASLGPGVNVTDWFRFPEGGETAEQFTNYVTDDALAKMRAVGIRSVRLCFEERELVHNLDLDQPDTQRIAWYVAAVDRIVAHGMTVVVDPNPERDRALSNHDGPYVRAFTRFWGVLAGRLASTDPEHVLFEVLNEPAYEGRAAEWYGVENRLVGTIRNAAPHHTIITSGTGYASIDGLTSRTPLADRNVIYSFHFYEPFTFTHQGATWVGEPFPTLRGVPYPGMGAACDSAAATQSTAAARDLVQRYCAERWDAAHIEARVAAAAAWAQRYNVPLYVGEFGAYCKYSAPTARLQFLRDVRAALERHNIPWTVWGWDDCFGLGAERRVDGTWHVDSASTVALGFDFSALR